MDILKLFFCFLFYANCCVGYFVNINANDEQCFYDKVTSGTKMNLMFEVTEGGSLDIDVQLIGPDQKVIYTGDRESNGKYVFAAHMDGMYKYCFSNKMSTVTPKKLMFSMDIGDKPQAGLDNTTDVSHSKLEEMTMELSAILSSVKHEQEYMIVRERIHRAINDSTNSRVVLWSFFEAFIILSMSVGQIFYLKRFFEIRRVV